MKIIKPFPGIFRKTQDFGAFFWYRKKRVRHMGTDWALPKGTPVVACFNGIVSRVEKWRIHGYGRSIYLRSNDGNFEALYAHLSKIDVEVGQRIKRAEKIGESGKTGFWRGKTGYHLHFGLKKNGVWVNCLKYFVSEGQKLIVEDKEKKEVKNVTNGYIVKKGDSLYRIAIEFYGNGSDWPKIFNANRSEIGENPDKIYPGQVLKIPGQE